MTEPDTVARVPNKRGEGQKMVTFWLPEAEFEAAKEAVAYLDATKPAGAAKVTMTDECRRALRNTVKRAEKKREIGQ